MGAGRIIGGVLALIGSVLLLIPALIEPAATNLMTAIAIGGMTLVIFLIVFIVVILALIGAILALANKRGTLALIAGLVLLVFGILPLLLPADPTILALATQSTLISGAQWYILTPLLGIDLYPMIFMTLETILILVGGLIATVAGE